MTNAKLKPVASKAKARGTGAGSLVKNSVEVSQDPLYKQLVDSLKSQILKGAFPVGDRLPTESDLRAMYGVSRHTVREALRQLRTDGLVTSRQGSGTTVIGSDSTRAFVHEIGSIADLIQYASSIRFKVDKTETIVADAELAKRLGAGLASRWIRFEGYRYADEDTAPVCWTVIYVHSDFAGVGRMVGRTEGAVYDLIETLYGVRVVEVEQTVHARPAPNGIESALRVDPGATVVEVARVYRLSSGQVAQVAVSLYPADRFSLTMKLRSRGS